MTADLTCVAPVGDWCGEAAMWSPDDGRLYWCDVNRFLIHALQSGSGAVSTWFFDEPVTALALTEAEGELLVSLGSRLIRWTPATDTRRDHGFRLAEWPGARLNDGRASPDGAFWVGSMGNNVGPNGEGLELPLGRGVLYRVAPGGGVTTHKDGIGVSNTVCWSPDKTRFYFGDSVRNAISVWDYDPATGGIANERPFFEGYERGGPDGSCIDSEGCLWNCRWGGGSVVRVTPDGQIDRVVEIPSHNVTTCTFGGDALDTLYITTAAIDGAPSQRLAGSLFALKGAGRGVPDYRVRL